MNPYSCQDNRATLGLIKDAKFHHKKKENLKRKKS